MSHQRTNGCGIGCRFHKRGNLAATAVLMLLVTAFASPLSREGFCGMLPLMGSGANSMVDTADGRDSAETEYQIKAAFIFNFMKFTEWPREKELKGGSNSGSDKSIPMKIAIVGKSPFGRSFIPIQEKTIRERPIEVVEFPSFYEFSRKYGTLKEALERYSQEYLDQLHSCHVLYLCESERPVVGVLMPLFRQAEGLLTISDLPRFVDEGGVIGFRKEGNKVRFEVNLKESERQQLRISSQLLKLAIRVERGE